MPTSSKTSSSSLSSRKRQAGPDTGAANGDEERESRRVRFVDAPSSISNGPKTSGLSELASLSLVSPLPIRTKSAMKRKTAGPSSSASRSTNMDYPFEFELSIRGHPATGASTNNNNSDAESMFVSNDDNDVIDDRDDKDEERYVMPLAERIDLFGPEPPSSSDLSSSASSSSASSSSASSSSTPSPSPICRPRRIMDQHRGLLPTTNDRILNPKMPRPPSFMFYAGGSGFTKEKITYTAETERVRRPSFSGAPSPRGNVFLPPPSPRGRRDSVSSSSSARGSSQSRNRRPSIHEQFAAPGALNPLAAPKDLAAAILMPPPKLPIRARMSSVSSRRPSISSSRSNSHS